MCEQEFLIQTLARNYDPIGKQTINIGYTPFPDTSLHIEKLVVETMPRPPKGVLQHSIHNPHARVSHNYSIMEDFA